MGVRGFVRRHRVLVIETVVFTVLAVVILFGATLLHGIQDASPDAGGVAVPIALFGLLLVAASLGGAVLTLCVGYLYRRRSGLETAPLGPALVLALSAGLAFLIGVWAVPFWVVTTSLYFWGMCVYRR